MYIYPDMVIIDCVSYRFSNHGVNMISLHVILVEILMYSEEFWWLYWKYYTLMGPTFGLYEMIVIKWKIFTGTVTVGIRAKVY